MGFYITDAAIKDRRVAARQKNEIKHEELIIEINLIGSGDTTNFKDEEIKDIIMKRLLFLEAIEKNKNEKS